MRSDVDQPGHVFSGPDHRSISPVGRNAWRHRPVSHNRFEVSQTVADLLRDRTRNIPGRNPLDTNAPPEISDPLTIHYYREPESAASRLLKLATNFTMPTYDRKKAETRTIPRKIKLISQRIPERQTRRGRHVMHEFRINFIKDAMRIPRLMTGDRYCPNPDSFIIVTYDAAGIQEREIVRRKCPVTAPIPYELERCAGTARTSRKTPGRTCPEFRPKPGS